MVRLIDPEELADFVAEKATKDPAVRKLVEEVRMYDDLLEHVGWRRLRERVEEQHAAYTLALAKRLMAGEDVPREEITWYRAYYQGAKDIIQRPALAHVDLEKKARKAYTEAEIELANNSQEESPYA